MRGGSRASAANASAGASGACAPLPPSPPSSSSAPLRQTTARSSPSSSADGLRATSGARSSSASRRRRAASECAEKQEGVTEFTISSNTSRQLLHRSSSLGHSRIATTIRQLSLNNFSVGYESNVFSIQSSNFQGNIVY